MIQIHFKLKMENGTLYGKVWQDGTTEPSTWPYSWQCSGCTGYPALNGGSANTNQGSATVSFDDVNVSANTNNPPAAAANPNPSNGAIGVSTSPSLSWMAGGGATSHDVYFGTSNPPSFEQNQTGTTYSPGTLSYSTTTGTVWSFATGSTPPSELLANPGFESGTSGWFPCGGTLTEITSPVHSGAKAVAETGRTATYNGPMQDIKSALLASGQGNYTLSAWVKLASGTGTGEVRVYITDNNGDHWFYPSGSVNSSGWTQVSGIQNITWSGTLSAAYYYVEISGTLVDVYVDDCSLTKQ